jgi:NAD-dependent deacetylase
VDGLHQRAGSRDVVELHGTILRARCFDRGHAAEMWPDAGPGGPLPRCAECGSRMRPDVVWFGESLPAAALQQACTAAADCEVLFSIGTSSVVYPAAGIAEIALESGATVVEINPEDTPLSSMAHFQLRGPCGDVLKELARQLSD